MEIYIGIGRYIHQYIGIYITIYLHNAEDTWHYVGIYLEIKLTPRVIGRGIEILGAVGFQHCCIIIHCLQLTVQLILWCLMLAQPLNNIGPFRLWVPLFRIASHLKSALLHGICPARFTSSLKLLFSPGPGLGAPLSSYLEGALYKFHR